MSENYIMLNGKRVDLTDDQLEKLGLKVKTNCFDRVKEGEIYYRIYEGVGVEFVEYHNGILDNERYNAANYCTDKSLMEQRALHETLSRLLWRFSMQNDGDKINWDNSSFKYFISYDYCKKEFCVDYYQTPYGCNLKSAMQYFYSVEVTQRAIDEIIKPFMKEHPEFVW